MKKTLVLAALLLALALVLTACGNKIEGTWTLDSVTGDAATDDISTAMALYKGLGGTCTMTFSKGTCTMDVSISGSGESYDYSYKTEGSKLIMDEAGEFEYSIKGDTLTLTSDGSSLVFTRSK